MATCRWACLCVSKHIYSTHTHTCSLPPPPAPLKPIIGSSSVTAVWLPVLRICSWSELSPSALAWLPWCMHTQTLDNLSAFTYAASALHTLLIWGVCVRGCVCEIYCVCVSVSVYVYARVWVFIRRVGEDEEKAREKWQLSLAKRKTNKL